MDSKEKLLWNYICYVSERNGTFVHGKMYSHESFLEKSYKLNFIFVTHMFFVNIIFKLVYIFLYNTNQIIFESKM